MKPLCTLVNKYGKIFIPCRHNPGRHVDGTPLLNTGTSVKSAPDQNSVMQTSFSGDTNVQLHRVPPPPAGNPSASNITQKPPDVSPSTPTDPTPIVSSLATNGDTSTPNTTFDVSSTTFRNPAPNDQSASANNSDTFTPLPQGSTVSVDSIQEKNSTKSYNKSDFVGLMLDLAEDAPPAEVLPANKGASSVDTGSPIGFKRPISQSTPHPKELPVPILQMSRPQYRCVNQSDKPPEEPGANDSTLSSGPHINLPRSPIVQTTHDQPGIGNTSEGSSPPPDPNYFSDTTFVPIQATQDHSNEGPETQHNTVTGTKKLVPNDSFHHTEHEALLAGRDPTRVAHIARKLERASARHEPDLPHDFQIGGLEAAATTQEEPDNERNLPCLVSDSEPQQTIDPLSNASQEADETAGSSPTQLGDSQDVPDANYSLPTDTSQNAALSPNSTPPSNSATGSADNVTSESADHEIESAWPTHNDCNNDRGDT